MNQLSQQQQSSNDNIDSHDKKQFNDEFQFYNPQIIAKYFEELPKSSISAAMSDFYCYERYNNVTEMMANGQLHIDPESVNIDSLLAKQQISQQQEKTQHLKHKKALILQQLSLLDQQLSRSKPKKNQLSIINTSRLTQNSDQNTHSNKKIILSKDEHQQFISRLNKQRDERQRKKLLLKQKESQKLKKLQEEQKLIESKRLEQEKRRRAKSIEEKLKINKQKHQKFLQQQKQSSKKVQQVKNKKFLHQQIQEKFEMNVKMPLLEEQKKILKQKRQFAKAYSIDEIKNHQKNYMQLRENSIKKSKVNQTENSISQTYRAPAKSSRLQKILQDEKMQQRQKLMEKKRAIEQKLQRQQNYVEYLKENFSRVKIDKNKEQEIKSRIDKKKVQKQEIDFKSIGMNYLEQAKKLRKKIPHNLNESIEKEETNNQGNLTVLSQQSNKKKPSQSRVSDTLRGNNLLKKRQQKIQLLINSTSINETQRIRKLKIQTQRINEAFKMKQQMLRYGYNEKVQDEAVELLLTSIQAKMGIIDIGKQKIGLKN